MRFQGQLFELRVPLGDAASPLPEPADIERAFREQYRDEYGFDLPGATVQLVNLRLEGTLPLGLSATRLFDEPGERSTKVARVGRIQTIRGRGGATSSLPVVRAMDAPGTIITGPALIEHSGSTVWIRAGDRAEIGRSGRVLIELSRGE
jgi:N-methylhydantoinase A